MTLVRIDPFRELAGVQDRLNRVFNDFYGRRAEDDVLSRGEWMPSVDIYESDQHELVLKAELPGLKKEDIDLRIENNMLTIRGERRRAHEIRDEQYHRVERSYGGFARSFTLPATIATDKVSAQYEDGVLTIVLPKRDEAKPRQVQVAVK